MILLLFAVREAPTFAEEFAEPPQWSDDVKAVFFDDARDALSGEPPTANGKAPPAPTGPAIPRHDDAIWRELITPTALEGAVKAAVSRVAQSVKQPARFKAGSHNDAHRDLTLLGVVLNVAAAYSDDVRWKSDAPEYAQLCLRTADACIAGTDESLRQTTETLAALQDLLRGQTHRDGEPAEEPRFPEFAPLMQVMEFVTMDELPAALSKRTQFRRSAVSVGEKAQLLAMLSQAIRGEAYGYADDETYQARADRLRDAARQLGKAATDEDFQQAVEAAVAIQKACADCHTAFRG